MFRQIFILYILIIGAENQPLFLFKVSKLVSSHLHLPNDILQEIAPKCASESKLFLDSLLKSLKIMEACGFGCLEEYQEHMFALKQLDAFGKLPSGISQWNTISEGSYSTCNDVDGEKYSTNYGYLILVPGKNVICPDRKEVSHDQIKLKLAICVPESCESKDIFTIFNRLSPLPLTACEAYFVKKETNIGLGFWIFSIFVILTMVLFGTATYIDFMKDERNENGKETQNLLNCFSLYTNVRMIFEIQPETTGDRLKGLNFLKCVTIFWVVVGHVVIQYLFGDALKPIFKARHNLWNHLVFDGAYAVEPFFMMAATILSFNLFKNSYSLTFIGLPVFWLKLLVRRYFRLMPPLMIFIAFFIFTTPFIRGSALASLNDFFDLQAETCLKKWWFNMFMWQNFIKPSEVCYTPSWHVANDFQFFIIARFVIVPLMQSPKRGLKIIIFLIGLSTFSNFYVFWYHNLPPTPYANRNIVEYFTNVHQNSFLRLPTFILGILLGKMLAINRKPVEILKNNTGKCWIIAGIVLFICFYGKLLTVVEFGKEDMSPISSAAHHVFHRFLWNIVILWIIYACQYDLGTTVTIFINSSYWQPLSRLTYCIFIIHWWMQYIVINLSDEPLHFVSMNHMMVTLAIPTYLMTIPFALLWSAMFEVPVTRVRDLLYSASG